MPFDSYEDWAVHHAQHIAPPPEVISHRARWRILGHLSQTFDNKEQAAKKLVALRRQKEAIQ